MSPICLSALILWAHGASDSASTRLVTLRGRVAVDITLTCLPVLDLPLTSLLETSSPPASWITLEDSFVHVLKAYCVLTCYIVILSQGGDILGPVALCKAAARPLIPTSERQGAAQERGLTELDSNFWSMTNILCDPQKLFYFSGLLFSHLK